MRHRAVITLLISTLPAVGVHAQEAQLENNDFTIDVVTGPILASGRVVGMGGAETALSTGVDSVPSNPAAFALRPFWKLKWFEWDVAVSVLLPGTFAKNDFDNDGSSGFRYSDFYFLDFGGHIDLGELGVGTLWSVQNYNVTEEEPFNVALATGHIGAAYNFFRSQLVAGASMRVARFNIGNATDTLVDFQGLGLEAGAVLKLNGEPWRVGASVKSSVTSPISSRGGVTEDEAGVLRAGRFILPSDVRLPWEASAGFAYQLGPRPLNAEWINPHEEERGLRRGMMKRRYERAQEQLAREDVAAASPQDRAWWKQERERRLQEEQELHIELERRRIARRRWVRELSRRYVLLSADLVCIGSTPGGIGIEPFLSQQLKRSGEAMTVSVRGGMETEPLVNRLRLRFGSYLEPSRFETGSSRLHGTTGVVYRLGEWNVFGLFRNLPFRVAASADVAQRYVNWGFGFGIWH